MQSKEKNIIVELSFQFAIDIANFSKQLEEKKRYVIANQVLRSGTSIGASIREAQNAESKPDFIHKMKIAAKEADETEYWLLILSETENLQNTKELLMKVKDLIFILSKIIGTSKRSL
ncbi:MAG: four helix bundle protein [Bacteroidetes bacterium]|nr:four helix bundle protein [Bacteroidota bacterium]